MTNPVTVPYNPQQSAAKTILEMLEERGNRYGSFDTHAAITQQLKEIMYATANWQKLKLSYAQKEALEMIAHKIGRILNGDPNYADSWTDIAGYAELVASQLMGNN